MVERIQLQKNYQTPLQTTTTSSLEDINLVDFFICFFAIQALDQILHSTPSITPSQPQSPTDDESVHTTTDAEPTVFIQGRDAVYPLLLRLFEHFQEVLPKIIPKAAKPNKSKKALLGPQSSDLRDLLDFVTHNDSAPELVYMIMEDRYRTWDMKQWAYTVGRVFHKLCRHASISVRVAALCLLSAHQFLTVCQDATEVELEKVEVLMDEFRRVVRPNHYREARGTKRQQTSGGTVGVVITDGAAVCETKRMLVSAQELIGRTELLQTTLQRLASSGGAVVLSGCHGIGKTALAIEVGKQKLDDYPRQHLLQASSPEGLLYSLRLLLLVEGYQDTGQNLCFEDVCEEARVFLQNTDREMFLVFDDVSDPSLISPFLSSGRHAIVITTVVGDPWTEAGYSAVQLKPLATQASVQLVGQTMASRKGGKLKFDTFVKNVPEGRAKIAEHAEVDMGNIPLGVRFIAFKMLEKGLNPNHLADKLVTMSPETHRQDRHSGGMVHIKGYLGLTTKALDQLGENVLAKRLSYCLALLVNQRWSLGFVRLIALHLSADSDVEMECDLLEATGLVKWTSSRKDSIVLHKMTQMHLCELLREVDEVGEASRSAVIKVLAELANVLEADPEAEKRIRQAVQVDFCVERLDASLETFVKNSAESLSNKHFVEATTLQLRCMHARNAHILELADFREKLNPCLHERKISAPMTIDESFDEHSFFTSLWNLPKKDIVKATMFIVEPLDAERFRDLRLRILDVALRCLVDKGAQEKPEAFIIELAEKMEVSKSLLATLVQGKSGYVAASIALSLVHGYLESKTPSEAESFAQLLLKKVAAGGGAEVPTSVLVRQRLHVANMCAVIGFNLKKRSRSDLAFRWFVVGRETLASLPKQSYRAKELTIALCCEILLVSAKLTSLDIRQVTPTLENLREDLRRLELPLPERLLIAISDSLLELVKERLSDLSQSSKELLRLIFFDQICHGRAPYVCLMRALEMVSLLNNKAAFQQLFERASCQLSSLQTTRQHAEAVYELYDSLRTWYKQRKDKNLYCDVSASLLCIVDELFLEYGFLQAKGKLLVTEMKRGPSKERALVTLKKLAGMCEKAGKKEVAELLRQQRSDLTKPEEPPPQPKTNSWGRWRW